MNIADAAWSWMHVLTKKRYELLLKSYGNLGAALQNISEEMLRSLGCSEQTAMKALNRLADFDPDRYAAHMQKLGVRLLSMAEEGYPRALRDIADPPVFLYVKGSIEILSSPSIALVGTRTMSMYGKRVTERIVPPIVAAGMTTVSGLALGIDTAVANATLEVGGKTVAVLGHGLSRIFPSENVKLAERIVAGGGAIVSEFPLDHPPGTHTFPARNRIIAGLSAATVVLEAPTESGALITAELALDYGREVLAVPGDIFNPTYAGCHTLIRKGHAAVATSADDILQTLGVQSPEAGAPMSAYTPASADEAALLNVLTPIPQHIDVILERASIDAAKTSATLTLLELAGGAKHLGNGMWVKV